jgi:hypothetical protein
LAGEVGELGLGSGEPGFFGVVGVLFVGRVFGMLGSCCDGLAVVGIAEGSGFGVFEPGCDISG